MSAPTTNGHTQMNGNGASSWTIHASRNSKRTVNPIRAIVDTLVIPKNATKSLIPLSIGDPTVFGNLEIPQSMEEALIKVIQGRRANGYPPSIGTLDARTAVATRYTTEEAPITPTDVILASGCSGALAIAIAGLCDEGDNILLPKPGFSLYKTLAGHDNVEARYYNLLPEKSWEIDLKHLESLIDEKTRAIVVNNPGNPTGSNFTREHLVDILTLAEQHHLPIISDEIYGDMVFHPHTFIGMARLTTEVPIISVGGIAKQYLVPGWRVGWLTVHDRHDRLKEVREGLNSLSQLILGPNSLIQAALPEILHHTLPSFYSNLIQTLQSQAEYLTTRLNQIAGLRAIAPQGAMYLMAEVLISQFTDIKDDRDYVQKLLDEEMVFLLPASCFMAPNFVRFVFCAPIPILNTACDRIAAFNTRHIKPEYANTSYSTIQALKQVALVTMVDVIAANGVTTQTTNGSPLVVPTPIQPASASSS